MRKGLPTSVILATLFALGLPSFALAASPSQADGGSIKVAYGDLDVNTRAGAEKLYARLERATEKACDLRPYRELGSIGLFNESRSCYSERLSAAVERINSDELTRVHTNG